MYFYYVSIEACIFKICYITIFKFPHNNLYRVLKIFKIFDKFKEELHKLSGYIILNENIAHHIIVT